MVDFSKKISYQRYTKQAKDTPNNEYALINFFESDRGRILNSAAIRRLQQKTQVFPLERNAVVRSRLTHSLEVQQVGRNIVKEIIHNLANSEQLSQFGLDKVASIVESLVEMACLMHDIGNPPFGHFGETAINNWFSHKLAVDQLAEFPQLNYQQTQPQLDELRYKIRQDLCNFDGNAQAIRLVHTILKLNLTFSQIACILKYTKPAYWCDPIPAEFNYLMKKPGFYLSEEQFVTTLMNNLDLQPFHRFPLTYIMEAADDISYCIADLEDAVEKRILTVDLLYQYLLQEWGPYKKGDLFDTVVHNAYFNALHEENNAMHIDHFFWYLRANTTRILVPHAAERFIENIEPIFYGAFNHALLDDHDAEFKLLEIFKKVAFKYIFHHDAIETIELQGYRIINGLLDIYNPLLSLPTADFLMLVAQDRHPKYMIETRLFHKLPEKHRQAYQNAICQLDQQSAEFNLWEFYYRARLLQDYISGMTDHFAYDEYRKLMVTD